MANLTYKVHPVLTTVSSLFGLFEWVEHCEPHVASFSENIKNPSQPTGIVLFSLSWCLISESLQSEIFPFSHSSPINAESPINWLCYFIIFINEKLKLHSLFLWQIRKDFINFYKWSNPYVHYFMVQIKYSWDFENYWEALALHQASFSIRKY